MRFKSTECARNNHIRSLIFEHHQTRVTTMPTSLLSVHAASFIRRMFLCAASCLLLIAHNPASAQDAADKKNDRHSFAQTRSLFDGESFAGWEGTSEMFRIEDGAIVAGRLGEPIAANAFLCSTDEFSDFELRVTIRLDGPYLI